MGYCRPTQRLCENSDNTQRLCTCTSTCTHMHCYVFMCCDVNVYVHVSTYALFHVLCVTNLCTIIHYVLTQSLMLATSRGVLYSSGTDLALHSWYIDTMEEVGAVQVNASVLLPLLTLLSLSLPSSALPFSPLLLLSSSSSCVEGS